MDWLRRLVLRLGREAPPQISPTRTAVSGPDERLERAASLIAERLGALRFDWNARGTEVVGPGTTALRIEGLHDDNPRHFDVGFVFNRNDPHSRVIWDCTTGWAEDLEEAVADAVDKWVQVSAPVWLELMTLRGEFCPHYHEDDPDGFAGWHSIHGPLFGWGNPVPADLVGWIKEHPLLPMIHDAVAPGLKTIKPPVALRFFFGPYPKPGGVAEVQINAKVSPEASEALGNLPWPRPEDGLVRAFVLLVHTEPELAQPRS